MEDLRNIFNIILGLILIICLFFMYRNYWVYIKRGQILDKDYNEFKKLISYDAMFWRFWIWDINKMKRK